MEKITAVRCISQRHFPSRIHLRFEQADTIPHAVAHSPDTLFSSSSPVQDKRTLLFFVLSASVVVISTARQHKTTLNSCAFVRSLALSVFLSLSLSVPISIHLSWRGQREHRAKVTTSRHSPPAILFNNKRALIVYFFFFNCVYIISYTHSNLLHTLGLLGDVAEIPFGNKVPLFSFVNKSRDFSN